jgi:nitrogen fixation NifU-like protein
VAGLYGDVILDRFKHPRRQGAIEAPDAWHEDVNPLCGDRVRVEVRLRRGQGSAIEAVRYRGDACAIALATADLLAEMAEGRSTREAEGLDRDALLAALRAEIRPARLRCVTLPLDVFRGALAKVAGRARIDGRDNGAGPGHGSGR